MDRYDLRTGENDGRVTFSSIVELGSFGAGFAAGWIGTTFALAKMMDE